MKERITKLDAARRQLTGALSLYFDGGDLLCAWALGAAAYNVLRDLNRLRGGSPLMLKEQLPKAVPEHDRETLARRINETENFLKHADRDPHAALDFEPDGRIELLLFDASLAYYGLSGSDTPQIALMRMWFLANVRHEHNGGTEMDRWFQSISRMPDETPKAYRERLWSRAVAEATKTTPG